MISNQTTVYTPRPNRQSRYDKRLILKIVKEVEQGLPRNETIKIYGLGKSTLDSCIKYMPKRKTSGVKPQNAL